MSKIRRQSIISSLLVYFGFALGFLNTYLFTKQGGFSKAEYGLTSIFIAIATLMFSIANLGMPAYIFKFYPYYNDNLDKKRNDILTWSLLISLFGFCLIIIGGIYFKQFIIDNYAKNSPLILKYYLWIFPLGLGLTLYSTLEMYAWQLKKSVVTTFLKEVQFRLFTTILIILVLAGVFADFDLFIKIYSLTYLATAFILLTYLAWNGHFHLTFKISNVTRKFFKKIIVFILFIYGGSLVFTISSVFDSILIAKVLKDGLESLAIYTLAQNIASLIQAPQRGIVSAASGALSQAWKDKDLGRIDRIYKQSSINQLIFAIGMFALIWLNFSDGVFTFKMQSGYIDAKPVFLFIGLMRIIDMGTGINSQIISSSTKWKFEFITGLILIAITLPLNYILTKYYFGVIGPAIANLFSFTVYNAIRYWFLYKKFNLQPFTIKTIITILIGVAAYYCCYFLFNNYSGLLWIVIRSSAFVLLYGLATIAFNLSADILPIWQTLLKKVGLSKEVEQ